MVTAAAAKTAAATSRRPSTVLTNTAPTAQATKKPTWCSVPRSSGRVGRAVSDIGGDLLQDPGVRLVLLDPTTCGDLGCEQLAGLTEELVCNRLARGGGEPPLAVQTLPDDLRQSPDLAGRQLLLREA